MPSRLRRRRRRRLLRQTAGAPGMTRGVAHACRGSGKPQACCWQVFTMLRSRCSTPPRARGGGRSHRRIRKAPFRRRVAVASRVTPRRRRRRGAPSQRPRRPLSTRTHVSSLVISPRSSAMARLACYARISVARFAGLGDRGPGHPRRRRRWSPPSGDARVARRLDDHLVPRRVVLAFVGSAHRGDVAAASRPAPAPRRLRRAWRAAPRRLTLTTARRASVVAQVDAARPTPPFSETAQAIVRPPPS